MVRGGAASDQPPRSRSKGRSKTQQHVHDPAQPAGAMWLSAAHDIGPALEPKDITSEECVNASTGQIAQANGGSVGRGAHRRGATRRLVSLPGAQRPHSAKDPPHSG